MLKSKAKKNEVFYKRVKLVLLLASIEVIVFQFIEVWANHHSTDVVGLFGWIPYWGEKGLALQMMVPLQYLVLPIATFLFLRTGNSRPGQVPKTSNWKMNSKEILIVLLYYLSLLSAYSSFFYYHYVSTGEFLNFFIIALPVITTLSIIPFLVFRKRKIANSQVVMTSSIIILLALSYLIRNINFGSIYLKSIVFLTFLTIVTNFLVVRREFSRYLLLFNSVITIRNLLLVLGCTYLLYSKPLGDIRVSAYEDHWYANLVLNSAGSRPFQGFLTEHGIWSDFYRYKIASLFSPSSKFLDIYNSYSIAIKPFEISLVFLVFAAITRNVFLTIQVICIVKTISVLFNLEIEYGQMVPYLILVYISYEYLRKSSSRKKLFLQGISCGVSILWSVQILPGILGFCLLLLRVHKGKWKRNASDILTFMSGCVSGSLGLSGIFGLADDFIRNTKWESSGYFFSWGDGINYRWDAGFTYFFLFFAVPLFLFSLIGWMSKVFLDKNPSILLALVPLIFGVGATYMKFLGWPDWHLRHPQILLLWTGVLLAGLQITISKKIEFSSKLLTYLCVTSAFMFSLNQLQEYEKFRFQAIQPNDKSTNSGFSEADGKYIEAVFSAKREFRRFLTQTSHQTVLDLSNEPVSWYGIAGYQPPIGVTKILNLASRATQQEVINALKKTEISGVIWGGDAGIWTWPNGGAWIRQYLLTQYVLENFVPVANSGPYSLFVPKQEGQDKNSNALNQVRKLACELRDLPKKFLPPERYSAGVPWKIQPNVQFENVIKPRITSGKFVARGNTIFMKVSADTSLKLVPTDDSGEITFNLQKSQEFTQVWLANCPSWKLQGKDVTWLVRSSNPSTKVEVAFPVDKT